MPMLHGIKPNEVYAEGALGSALYSRRDRVLFAVVYITPILVATRLHSTRGQFFARLVCRVSIRLRTNTSLIRAYRGLHTASAY